MGTTSQLRGCGGSKDEKQLTRTHQQSDLQPFDPKSVGRLIPKLITRARSWLWEFSRATLNQAQTSPLPVLQELRQGALQPWLECLLEWDAHHLPGGASPAQPSPALPSTPSAGPTPALTIGNLSLMLSKRPVTVILSLAQRSDASTHRERCLCPA